MAQFVQRGRELIDRGQHQEAVRVCRLGLLANPTEVDGRLLLGSALMALGRYDEVLAEMRVAIEMAPHSVRAHTLRAEALLQKDDALQAREVVGRALELDPADAAATALSDRIQEVVGGSGRGARAPSASFLDPLESATRELPPGTGRGFSAAALASRDSSRTIELDPDLEGVEVVPDDPIAAGGSFAADSAEAGAEVIEVVDSPGLSPRGAALQAADAHNEGPDAPTGMFGDIDDEPTEFSDGPRSAAGSSAAGRREFHSGLTDPERPSPPPELGASPFDVASEPRDAPVGGFDERDAIGSDSEPSWASFPSPGPDEAELSGEGPPRGRTDDMRLIRKGLGMEDTTHSRLAAPGQHAVASDGERAGRRQRARPGPPVSRYALVALVVLFGAVYVGLEVRDVRLEREIRRATLQAEAEGARDTYLGYLRSAATFRRIATVRENAQARAALARTEAALAADFGEHLELARTAVNAIDADAPSRDSRAARALLAIAEGDAVAARARAGDFVASYPADPLGGYLEGRAAMVSGDWAQAIERLRAAQSEGVAPRVYVRLGQAQAGLGRYSEAIAAFESALGIVEDHPAASLGEIHARLRGGKLGGDPAQYEQRVRAVIAEGQRPATEQGLGVARGQLARAYLVLAELALARDARNEAVEALERALELRRADDFGFSEAAIAVLLELGLVARAQAEAARALALWPERGRLRIAEIALRRGNPQKSLDTLEGVSEIARRPLALTLRGRARLMLDDIEGAAKDLDAALALSPRFRGALVARAELDLRRGDGRAAVKRLVGIYRSDPHPDVATVYARALRIAGDLEAAGAVLDKLGAADRTAQTLLEIARLAQASGDFDAARKAYAAAIEADPETVVARLESALMAFDVGDATGASEGIEALVREVGDDAAVLAAAARVRSLTGDFAGAAELVGRLEKVPAAPRWVVRRERGRLELVRKRPEAAVEELELAVALRPEDGETRYLLLSAYLDAEDGASAGKVLRDILKRFAGQPVADLAHGRVHFYKDRPKDALLSFGSARDELIERKAAPRRVGEAMYWLGRVHYYNGDLDAARDGLRDAISRNPAGGDAYYVLGQVEFEAKNLAAAASAYERATQAHPRFPDAWFALGETLARLRRKKAAREALGKYLELAPDGDLAEEARRLRRKL